MVECKGLSLIILGNLKRKTQALPHLDHFFESNARKTMIWPLTFDTKMVKSILKFQITFLCQPIINGTFSVDTFFVLSGLLTAYLFFKRFAGKEQTVPDKVKTVYNRGTNLNECHRVLVINQKSFSAP